MSENETELIGVAVIEGFLKFTGTNPVCRMKKLKNGFKKL